MRSITAAHARRRVWTGRISFGEPRSSFSSRFGQHGSERYRHPSLPFAFIRRFHESKDLDRFLCAYRRLATFEKAHNLLAQLIVTTLFIALADSFAAEEHGPIIRFVPANPPISSHPPFLPDARNQVGVFGLNARDCFTA